MLDEDSFIDENNIVYTIERYVTRGGKDVFEEWHGQIRDQRAQIAVDRRINRMIEGTLATASHAATASGNFASISGLGSGSTSQWPRTGSYCFCAAEIRAHCEVTFERPWPIGTSGRSGMMRSRSHDDAMSEYYQNHPDYAIAMLNDILGDETVTPGELLIALRQMTRAFGGVTAIAEKARLNPTQMYRTLSAQGNPSLNSLSAILKAMNMRLVVAGRESPSSPAPEKPQRARKKPLRARAAATARAAAG